MSSTIDLNYVKREQKDFLEHLKSVEGIKYQESKFKVPKWLILAILSELVEVLNETKIHKWWDRTPRNDNRILEELSDLMAHIGNLANELDKELIITIEETQVYRLESTFIGLAYNILSLTHSKNYARTKVEKILSKFIEIVYALGFDMDELKEAYFRKMKSNYTNPKFLK